MAKEYRHALLETAVEMDDAAMEAYLEGKEPDEETLHKCIRKGTISQKFVPVICGSAFKNKAVQVLLDSVIRYLPSPLDMPAVKGTQPGKEEIEVIRKRTAEEPFSGLAFKIMNDPFVGSLTFVRIYSGVLESGTGVLNSIKDRKERIGRMLLMHANNREEIKSASAGDIVALVGMKDTTTGETLCDPNKPIILERMIFPDPVIEVAVEPKSKPDVEKMGVALGRLAAEDPSLRISTLSCEPVISVIMASAEMSTTRARNTFTSCSTAVRCSAVTPSFTSTSSRTTAGLLVTSSTRNTFTSLYKLASARRAPSSSVSTTIVMRETPACSVRPTVSDTILNARRRTAAGECVSRACGRHFG